jgi:hypothetical protein
MINYAHPTRTTTPADTTTPARIDYTHPRRTRTTPAAALARRTVILRAGESVTLGTVTPDPRP